MIFTKNKIYKVDDHKMVCILVDDEYACLCAISKHRSDNGYKIKFDKSAVYAATIPTNGVAIEQIGFIEEGVYNLNPF